MKCLDVNEQLSAYLDGELPPHLLAEVASHLRECKSCAGELAELARVRSAVSSLPPAQPPGYAVERVLRAVMRVHRRRTASARVRGWASRLWGLVEPRRRPTAIAAAVAIVLALIIAPWSLFVRSRGAVERPGTDWDAMAVNLRQAPRTLVETAAGAGKGIQGVFQAFGRGHRDGAPPSQPPGDGAMLEERRMYAFTLASSRGPQDGRAERTGAQ
ncbi:MAG: anti-sigma factor family protein [Armatimonadota bacterium]